MKRWQRVAYMDAVWDTEHIYPPITALELFNRERPFVNRKDRWTLHPWATDDLLTDYARRRPLRHRPWKRAR